LEVNTIIFKYHLSRKIIVSRAPPFESNIIIKKVFIAQNLSKINHSSVQLEPLCDAIWRKFGKDGHYLHYFLLGQLPGFPIEMWAWPGAQRQKGKNAK